MKRETQLVNQGQTGTLCPTALSVLGRACVPQLVAEHAAANPQGVAVVAGTEFLTYAELDHRANILAHQLKAVGVGPDALVGLHVERSPALVIGALAILKAGGAYLPLDPSFPDERLQFMLEDANALAVVTHSAIPRRSCLRKWRTFEVDSAIGSVSDASECLSSDLTPSSLAYVIYTSGSSGQPKGVEITHENLLNLVSWHRRAFEVSPSDRASLQAALGFDAAVWELWPYLVAGASIYIPSEPVRNNPEALRDWLIANRINITFLPTGLAERMLQLHWPPDAALRVLLTGADTLHRRPAANLPFRLINNYGPTECTVVATSGPVSPEGSSDRPPSIGIAVDNTQTYVLDESMREVPSNATGELYIGGAGVARGYRNNPKLTAESFIPNPFSTRPGDRLYRTGDLVRVLPNGEIEFLGRADEQIKIRGYRIEPNEIITALNALPEVESSTVLLDKSGEKRLVAYIVVKAGCSASAAQLREALRKHLPNYMIPAVFVSMDSLPLTVNGKIDRSALPAPATANTLPDVNFVAPRTLVEKRLAAILAPLLRLETVSVKDNFFLLGGHSLLGTQLITRISQTFGVDLGLLSLFDHPTLEEMSIEVEKLILAKVEAIGGGNGNRKLPHSIAEEPS